MSKGRQATANPMQTPAIIAAPSRLCIVKSSDRTKNSAAKECPQSAWDAVDQNGVATPADAAITHGKASGTADCRSNERTAQTAAVVALAIILPSPSRS